MTNVVKNMFDIFSDFKDKNYELEKKREDCINCDNYNLVYDDGIYYCSSCGISKNKQLSEGIEYRYYGELDNKSSNPERLGMPTNMLLPKSSLGSLISSTNSSHNFKKMIQYNSWNSMPYKERSQ